MSIHWPCYWTVHVYVFVDFCGSTWCAVCWLKLKETIVFHECAVSLFLRVIYFHFRNALLLTVIRHLKFKTRNSFSFSEVEWYCRLWQLWYYASLWHYKRFYFTERNTGFYFIGWINVGENRKRGQSRMGNPETQITLGTRHNTKTTNNTTQKTKMTLKTQTLPKSCSPRIRSSCPYLFPFFYLWVLVVSLPQAQWGRCNTDDHRIENCSVIKHHLYSGSWNESFGIIFYLYSWEDLVRYDLNRNLGSHRFYYFAPLPVLDPIFLSLSSIFLCLWWRS